MKSAADTLEKKLARSNNGGDAQAQRSKLDMIWEEVQEKNRAGLGWKAPQQAQGGKPSIGADDARECAGEIV